MRCLSIGFLSLLVCCSGNHYNNVDEIASLHSAPQVVPLNTDEGYAFNPFTGDSIKPIITTRGDTLISGVPVSVRGRVIDPGNVAKPKVILAGEPRIVPGRPNLDNNLGAFNVIPVDNGSLRTIPARIDPSLFTNHTHENDTISTIMSIPGIVRTPSRQPKAVKALPPLMKGEATTNIKILDVGQGMSSTNLIALLEDSRGHIWIATQTKGVSMYNGESFRHYTTKEGLCSNVVMFIMEDDHGNLWFGSNDGISIFDGDSFRHLTLKEDYMNISVCAMLKDRHGRLWFGTDQGVFMYDGKSIIHLTEREGLINNQVWSVIEDNNGLIWIGTIGGVSIYNGKTFTHLTQQEGLTSNRVWFMLKDSQGLIWIGTDIGLNVYDGEFITHITEKDGLINNVVRTITEDSHGNLWFGTHGGVNMYDGESMMHFSEIEGLSSNRIRAILEDSQGNFWFGTENGGISIFYGNTFTYLTRKDGFGEDGILSFLKDSQGNYWFGNWGSGVSMYDGQTFRHFSQKEGLIQNAVWSILEDKQMNLWFGTYDGLCKYDGSTFTHFTLKEGLSDNDIRAMLEDSHGNLWIGTQKGGVNMYNGESFTHYTEEEGFYNNRVRAILEDSHGNIWFGTANGVSKYDGDTWIHYTEKEGLSNNFVRCILEDKRGNMWFGTRGGGVNMFNGSNFTYFTQNEGLSNNNISTLVEDHNRQIWISTANGLNRLVFEPGGNTGKTKHMFECTPEIHSYGLKDGLKSAEFLTRCVFLESQNRIWWGSPKGTLVLDTDHLKKSFDPPVIHLSQVDLNGQFIDYRQLEGSQGLKMEFSEVSRFYNYPLHLELPYTHNHLTLHFAAIDWSASQNLQYAFVMEGLDDHWNAQTSEALADYRNIPPGRYTFKVRAIGAAEKWSEPFEYTFMILPPPWLKWWAYIIYSSIIILLIRWYREFLIKREQINADLRIKEAEVDKMQELDHMKSRFFANISHEFRTPLTLIQAPIEELRKKFQGNREGSIQLFQTVKRNITRLQELINQLLDISKLETGNMTLQVSPGDLVTEIKKIVLSFHSLADHKKIIYEYHLPEEERIVYFDPDKIEKIVTNLISNAFKFTPGGGNIRVDVQFQGALPDRMANDIEIKVSDTGKGIPEEMQDRIFDRFYQVHDSNSREAEGSGLGLALTKELVELYRGNIKVESQLGKGSNFMITLPVSLEQFLKEEIVPLPRDQEEEPELEPEPVVPVYKDEDVKRTVNLESYILNDSREKPLILIVEDNDDLRKYIYHSYESSYRILTAENGRIGLDKALKNIPDLVISDVMMPVMDGMEMCKLLKTDERTDHIPVVMLTARADKESKLEGLETGADDYLVKPFDIEELEVRIRNLLEQRLRLIEKFRLEFTGSGSDTGIPKEQQFIRKLFDIYYRHVSDSDFRMDQISEELHLSQSQIRRKVLALTGYSPTELFRNHRLKKAATLFRDGHTHVAHVMHLVGFNNQSYFSKCFRELFQMTPAQYIDSLRK